MTGQAVTEPFWMRTQVPSNFRISKKGKFSGKRTLTANAHQQEYRFKVKITGRFTARTKAKGTFSETMSGAGAGQTCRTGKQTWKAPHVGDSG